MRQKIWIPTQNFDLSRFLTLRHWNVAQLVMSPHHIQPRDPAALHTLSMPVIPQEDPEVKVIISYPVSLSQSGLHKALPQKREKRHLVVKPFILILIVYMYCIAIVFIRLCLR